MKKQLIMATLGLLLLTTSSCNEEFLNLKNENAYGDDTYFKSAPQFNEAVVATYATLLQNGMYARDWYFIFDLLGNDAERSPALLGDLQQLSEFTFGTGQPQLTSVWQSSYRMIFRSNIVIDKLAGWNPTAADEKALKARLAAEVKFLRGYAYFQIVNLWGAAPLRKSFTDSQNFYAPRATKDDLWKQAEQDFRDAVAGLPIKYDDADLGRATKGAAVAMLGKSFLYQKKYAEAATQFELLTTAAYGYKLNANYDNQFSDKNSGSSESVFDVPHRWFGWGKNGANQYYMFGGQEAWGGQTTHTGRAQEYGFNDWKNVFVSNALAASFTYRDERNASYIDPRAKLVFYGNAASGGDVDYCNTCSGGPIKYDFADLGFRWRKYQPYEFQQNTDGPQSEINSQLIRYADVLLMLAEANIFQGKMDAALPLINQVRTRVGAFRYTTLGSQANATSLLQRERQIELAGEQVRYFDLIRWGLFKATINAEKNAVRNIYTTLRLNPVEDKHLLLPIPQAEKDANPTVAGQVANSWN